MIFGIGLKAKEETHSDATDRLQASVSWWIARAQESNDAGHVQETIDSLTNGLEKARTLRRHLTGRDA